MLTLKTMMIKPNWQAPANIHAYTTTRTGGFSQGPYASLNLAFHVGDDPQTVLQNRAFLAAKLAVDYPWVWPLQTHTTIVAEASHYSANQEADGLYTQQSRLICAILTADCLPLLICNRAGTEVAALHAGWRGLANGIIEAGVQRFQSLPKDLMVWLGPAIGPTAFEVGAEVRELFLQHDRNAELAFQPRAGDKWLANLYLLARQRLENLGVTLITGGDYCTFSASDQFFSYRKQSITGRMASFIWIDPSEHVSMAD